MSCTKDYFEQKLAVMKEVPYIQKVKGKDLGYAYAGEKQLIEKVRPAMVLHGFSVHPIKIEYVSGEPYTTSKGSTMQRMRVISTYRFSHSMHGHQDVVTVGEAADTGDKVAAKAMTLAFKYALRQWLMIETGDDPDKERPEYENKKTPFERGMEQVKEARAVEGEEKEKAIGAVKRRIESHKQITDEEKKQLVAMLEA